MDSDSEMDTTVMSELEAMKISLQTYQALNGDLSKKIQEYKINFNAATKEVLTLRQELMAEKTATSELRQALLMVNGQISQFFNTYIKTLQRCVERTDLQITLPLLEPRGSPNFVDTTSTAPTIQIPKVFRPTNRTDQEYLESNRNNLLNTICEETTDDSRDESRFSINDPNVASTPFPDLYQGRREVNAQLSPDRLSEKTGTSTELPSGSEVVTNTQKQCSSLEETDGNEAANLEESSTSILDETPKRSTAAAAPLIARRISQDSSPEPEDENEETRDEDQSINDSAQSETSLVEIKTIKCSANVTTLKPTKSQLKLYQKYFGNCSSTDEDEKVDESQTDAGSDDFGNVSATEMEVNEELLSDADTELNDDVLSIAGTSTTYQESDGASESSSKRKRKIKEILPRRSTGRPKRKTRQAIASLAEKSLKTKIRRSK